MLRLRSPRLDFDFPSPRLPRPRTPTFPSSHFSLPLPHPPNLAGFYFDAHSRFGGGTDVFVAGVATRRTVVLIEGMEGPLIEKASKVLSINQYRLPCPSSAPRSVHLNPFV
ncbi:hypothetical protein BU17DRAFT_103593 [Hysterangium stoloniferum]|nr:hypothetical protein BU17DRAFT_103593 [Hysterangium stoloniferum]